MSFREKKKKLVEIVYCISYTILTLKQWGARCKQDSPEEKKDEDPKKREGS